MSSYEVNAIGKKSKDGKFEKIVVGRVRTSDFDVDIDIKYCGLCHTDLHLVNGDLWPTDYPAVPGHEVAGVVTSVGPEVKDLEVGDHVGLGWYIDSCLKCSACTNYEENVCEMWNTATACGHIKFGRVNTDNGRYTYGGFSDKITSHRRFLTKINKSYPLQLAGPVFCAGITMFSPLKRFGATKGGLNVGIIGLGGLGQMGIKIAKAMGNTVTAISTNQKKEATARELGVDHFVISTNKESMAAAKGSIDLVLNTISAPHQVSTYFPLVKRNGVIVQLGAVSEPMQISNNDLLLSGICITGSAAAGTAEAQECMDLFAEKDIRFNIASINSAEELDQAVEALHKGNDSIVRYVLDIEKCTKN